MILPSSELTNTTQKIKQASSRPHSVCPDESCKTRLDRLSFLPRLKPAQIHAATAVTEQIIYVVTTHPGNFSVSMTVGCNSGIGKLRGLKGKGANS